MENFLVIWSQEGDRCQSRSSTHFLEMSSSLSSTKQVQYCPLIDQSLSLIYYFGDKKVWVNKWLWWWQFEPLSNTGSSPQYWAVHKVELEEALCVIGSTREAFRVCQKPIFYISKALVELELPRKGCLYPQGWIFFLSLFWSVIRITYTHQQKNKRKTLS